MKEPIRWRYAGDEKWIGAVDGVDVATAKKTGSALLLWGWTVHEPPAIGATDAAGTAVTFRGVLTAIAEVTETSVDYAHVTYPEHYRLTIEDYDPSWVEDRMADVHGMRYGSHWWTDRDGRHVEGYETGAVCGGCGWRPEYSTARPSPAPEPKPRPVDPFDPAADPIDSGLAAVRYENVFGHRPDPAKARRPDSA
jgi:hypothetical protein